MLASGNPKCLNDLAPTNGGADHGGPAMTYPVNNQNYGENVLGCDDAEWRTRVDLAAAYRLCHRYGFSEGVNNHLTAEVPGQKDHFLVFPFGLLWNEVTASNLLLVDMDGNVLKGKGQPEATAFWIHSRIHQLRPDTGAVFHTHQPEITSLACLEDFELPMIHQNSLRFYNDVAYDTYDGLVLDKSEGDRLAKALGDKRILIHRNHGIMVCAETVAEAFDAMYYLEQAARVTVKAMSTGRPLKIVPEAVAKQFKDTLRGSGAEVEYGRVLLEALKRDMLRGPDKDFIT
ncbi:Putative aldolase class 2 protein PA3430 [Coccomyxa sp. Obi]|nr:Putative aldolase class 2 protein PA3430 [Coccomyxa sp. Obi]